VALRLLCIPEFGWVLFSMFSGSQRLGLSLRLLLKARWRFQFFIGRILGNTFIRSEELQSPEAATPLHHFRRFNV
jgi:hypothetical protein